MAEPGRYALVVSSSRYSDPSLRPLTAPTEDAETLTELLRNPAIGGFRVREVVDQPSWIVRKEVQRFFKDRRLNDIALFYFSGHGIKDDDGTLYFAAEDTDPQLLDSTAVPSDHMVAAMSRCRSRQQVLLLDCCFAGAMRLTKSDERVGVHERFATEGSGRVVIAASDSQQFALERGKIKGKPTLSVFTHALVEGIESGEADQNADGRVSLDELYDYVFERVRQSDPNQSPTTSSFGTKGKIVIALNPHAGPAVSKPPRAATPSTKPKRTSPRDTAAPKRKPKPTRSSGTARRAAAGATTPRGEVLRQLKAGGIELSKVKRQLDVLSRHLRADEEVLGACMSSDWTSTGVLAVTSGRVVWARGDEPKVGELSYDQILDARWKPGLGPWSKLTIIATPRNVKFNVVPKSSADSLATLITERVTGQH
jgi:uncharacterized caspase-like protein